MKNIKHYLFAVVALVAGFAISACKETPEVGPQKETVKVEVSVDSVNSNGAIIKVATQGIKEFAYMQRDTELEATAILAAGEKKSITDSSVATTTDVTIQGLEPGTAYKVFFAFRQSDNAIYKSVVVAEFTTATYGDATLTVVERKYDGFSVHVQIPQEVKERGNALRYSTTSLAMYKYIRDYYRNIEPDMLLFNAQQYTAEDKTITYDEDHNYERDENGNVLEDGATFSDPKVPGEPGVFLVGEFAFMDDEEDPMYPSGWEPGYYAAMFDWDKWNEERETESYDYTNKKYWTGYFERLDIMTLEPEIIENGVDIKVTDITPIDACIQFTPSDDIAQYCILICTESEYEVNVLPLLENKEEHLRWFVGSYFAMMTFGTETAQGPSEIWLNGDWFVDTKGYSGQTIRVMVAGLGDGDGRSQSFDTMTFTLPEKTLPKPEIEVTPVETGNPYEVTFNIKNPNLDNPVTEVWFACNYTREYDAILKEYSYTELLQQMGNPLHMDRTAIEQVNSKDGFNFSVSSRDNATTRLAVLVYNWEGSCNNPDETGSTAVAEYTTPNAQFPARVNSELFTKLVGEWEATAPMLRYQTNEETGKGSWKDAGTYKSDIKIMAGVEYPETLPAEVYELYAKGGMDRDATDALYEEFVSLAEQYNARTRGYNRLLCLGYNFADKDYMLDITATPYELFTAEDYSVSQVSYMFYDFGPKWNLEIDKDGNVWLPIDMEKEFPLATFNFGLDYTFYMMGIGMNSYIGAPVYNNQGKLVLDSRFPVEVSDDCNTITIKPIIYNYKDSEGKDAVETYYPCVAQLQYGMATPLNPRVNGDVVLKRKGASTQSAKVNAKVGAVETQPVKSLGKAPVPVQRTYSMTPMDISMMKQYQRIVKENPIEGGSEAFHKRAQALVEQTYGIVR